MLVIYRKPFLIHGKSSAMLTLSTEISFPAPNTSVHAMTRDGVTLSAGLAFVAAWFTKVYSKKTRKGSLYDYFILQKLSTV